MKFKLFVSVLVLNLIGLIPISCKNKDCDSMACECGELGSYTFYVLEMKFRVADNTTNIDLDTSEYLSFRKLKIKFTPFFSPRFLSPPNVSISRILLVQDQVLVLVAQQQRHTLNACVSIQDKFLN